jgi:hypothetical protein
MVHQKFNINITASSWTNYLQVRGVQSTFCQDMIFNSNAQNKIINYYFQPEEPAFSIFRLDTSSFKNSAVAYENEVYKTIGSFTEFGSLVSSATLDDRELLMKNYLEFFGLADFITNIPEVAGTPKGEVKAGNFPNPFSNQTEIRFSVIESTDVEITIYDIFGKTISKPLNSQHFEKGDYAVKWYSEDDQQKPVPAGIYFFQLRIGEMITTGKMIKLDS